MLLAKEIVDTFW